MRWMVFMFVVRERMTPHKAGRSGLDMDQYRMLFCTCKVPGVTKDTILNYFKTGNIPALMILINVLVQITIFHSTNK